MVGKLIAHLRKQWMGALALFLVLCGGTAWALQANSVRSQHIKNGEVKLGDTSNKLRLKCRKGTRYHQGACIERKARPDVTWLTANTGCSNLGGRLPDLSELEGFRFEPKINLGNEGTWTATTFYQDISRVAFFVHESSYGWGDINGVGHPYRCAFPPKR